MTRTVQCSGCGRVRIGSVWTRDATVTVTDLGQCPTCLTWRQRVARARKPRQLVEALADPFTAVRHDAGDEFWKPKGEL